MSTGSNCEILQVKVAEWYYVLEDRNAPKNAWDWREYALAYGPFNTMEAAERHLFDNHPNPGGTATCELPAGVAELDLSQDLLLQGLIEQAPRNTRPVDSSTRPRW